MRVLVVGSGPAARRHVRIVGALGHDAAVARGPDRDPEPVAAELGVPVFAGLDSAAAWGPEALVVATPPSVHVAGARWGLGRGLPVLVEKPLADAPGPARSLVEAAASGRLVVAYNLRFHPALRAVAGAVAEGRIGRLLFVRAEVGSYLPSWHPELDYRVGAAARRELGGGALLTLAHELDHVLWIAGDADLAGAVTARVSALDIDAEDAAELVLRHAGGAVASVHVDLIDRAYNRRGRWVGEHATIEWSWGGPVTLSADGQVETLWSDDAFDLESTYAEEVRSFLAGEEPPGNHLLDALRALELIEEAKRS